MKTIGLYLTKSGKEAIRLKWDGKTYSWIGAYGAGSGQTLEQYQAMIADFLKTKRGMQTVIDATQI